jgi:hypothetical protein
VPGTVGSRPEGGQIANSSVTPEPLEEVVVTGSRHDSLVTTYAPSGLLAGSVYAAYWTFAFENWRYFDEAALVAGLTLALIEPTPLGEAAVLTGAAMSTSRALVPYYPTGNGFLGPTVQITLARGSVIDRYGGTAYSQFFSPTGTPMYARALPPVPATQRLRTFEVINPITVEAGQVSPWFGQIGYGIQYRTPSTLGEMLQRQVIREVGP